MRLVAAIVLVSVIAAPAHAQHAAEEKARAHFEIGLGLYRLGDYHGALKEFAAGYELARKPGFLLNLGQTYRKLGELRSARDMYRQFLEESRASDPARPEAQRILAEIEHALATQPPAPAREPATSPSSSAPQASSPAAASPSAVPPSSSPSPSSSSSSSSSSSPSPLSSSSSPSSAASPSPSPSPSSAAIATPPASAAPVEVHAMPPPRRRHTGLRVAGVVLGVAGIGLVGGGIGTAVAADHAARDLNALDASGAPFDPGKDHAYAVHHALSIALFTTGAIVAAAGVALVVVGSR